jgi:hypothetical protein
MDLEQERNKISKNFYLIHLQLMTIKICFEENYWGTSVNWVTINFAQNLSNLSNVNFRLGLSSQHIVYG